MCGFLSFCKLARPGSSRGGHFFLARCMANRNLIFSARKSVFVNCLSSRVVRLGFKERGAPGNILGAFCFLAHTAKKFWLVM
jgi:hypothetical protein